MNVLCFDMGSGGITAARFDEDLNVLSIHETGWDLRRDATGRATLGAADVEATFKSAANAVGNEPAAAVSIGCFMHSFLVLDFRGSAASPVYTWLDTTAPGTVERFRDRFGEDFHQRTGCHYHPMFPVFKIASIDLPPGSRVVSPKAMLVQALTDSCVEDYGMAAASGLFNIHTSQWDEDILNAANIPRTALPNLTNGYELVGKVTGAGAARFGIAAGAAVVNGSGDGFLANVGSGCDRPARMAITLGTSASVRQMIAAPALDSSAGAFCYRAAANSFLLGCASSNGGNAIDWARRTFGSVQAASTAPPGLPIFMPWLNGERSVEWDSGMRASWHGVGAEHTPSDMMRSAIEGVVFNLVQYTEVLQDLSGIAPAEIVLSGNAFLNPLIGSIVAALVPARVLQPSEVGQASLRGAAIYAWRALGHDATGAMQRLLDGAKLVEPVRDHHLRERYERFKRIRLPS